MEDKYEVRELKGRIDELENELKGAITILSSFSLAYGFMGRKLIDRGDIVNGNMLAIMAEQLKDPELCHKMFRNAGKNKDSLTDYCKQMEHAIKMSM